MYEYTPDPDRRTGMALSLTLATAGFFLLLPYPVADWLHYTLCTLGICLMISAFLLADRFVLTRFTYSLSLESGELELIVTERRRRRRRVVCRILCSSIIRLVEPGKPTERTDRRFNYCPDLRRRKSSHFLIVEDGDLASISFCPDNQLCELILSHIRGEND